MRLTIGPTVGPQARRGVTMPPSKVERSSRPRRRLESKCSPLVGPRQRKINETLETIPAGQAVGIHLGLRISNFAPKKPSNVRISTQNILTFDGLASPLELHAGRGMLIGVVAGLLSFGFLKIVGEPAVDRAIAFDTAMDEMAGKAKADHARAMGMSMPIEAPELVSRPVQAGVGLLAGVIVYSAAFGGLFALAFALSYGRMATSARERRPPCWRFRALSPSMWSPA